MKKKHFLFTSLTIAAILSANAAQAEEVGTTPTEPEKELVTGEADKDVVLEEPKKEFSGELVEALNAEKPQEEHSLLRSMPENSVPTDNTADVGGQGKADSDLLEESRAEVPKTEEESKTITSGYSNSGTKGAFEKLTLKPGETIGGGLLGSDNREYVLGSPNRLTYDEIEDGGTYLTAFYDKDDRRKISLASNLFSWLGYKLDQKNQDAVRAAIAKLLDEEMVDATRLLGGFELDATQKTLVQSHYDKASLALEKLKNGEDGASALPTFEEDRSFHALRIAGEKGELAVKVKTLLEESKTITSGYSNSGTKGAFEKLTLKPGETIGGGLLGSDNREYVLGSPNRLTYDEIEDGGTYLTAFYDKDDRRKISLASNLFSWLGYKLDQKNQDAVRAAIAKLLDEEMVDATRLLGGFELDATQKTLVQSHYDKASLALEKLKNGEDGASVLPTFEEDRSFHALRIAGEKGELAVKVKTLLTDQNGSQLTVETSPEDAVASLEVLAHIEPTEVNPSPIARLAGQDFDIYDIKLKDAQGQLVSTLKQNALVKLPVDSGKEVTKVIYLPETGEATDLPILKQDKAFVYFETNHFSHYGIVYKTVEQSTPKQPQTQTGMDIEAIKNGDYSSVQGIWNKVNDEQGQPEFIRITDNGFFSAPELNFKAVKLGEVKEVPNRYKWGRMVASSAGYPTDWLGYHNSEGSGATYIPKGGAYSLWDANLGKSVEKIATEDIIISRGLGYEAVYTRARSVAHFYGVTAGDYGMGTLVDSLGRSIIDNKTVVVTGQIGDTIDLNAVGGRFGREGKAIYRVTLSNGKDELTLPDYQSSFVLDETTKGYTKINIVYDTAMPKPKANDNNSKQNQPDKAPDTEKPNTNPNSGERQAYTAEQELIARVWKTVTGGTYPYGVVRREAGYPINYFNGIGHVFPKVTYYISEHSNRPYALSHEVTFSDNGDGTVTVYKVPKHWHVADEGSERLTKEILDTAQVIKLDELSKSETETIVKRATRYEGFSNGSSKNSTPQGQGNGKQTPAPQADFSTRRNQLLLELDKSPLTDEQKGQLAEKFAFANTEKELADVTAEFRRLVAALGQESKQQTPQALRKADAKATLPATGEAKPAVLATIGAGLLLASLGLVYHRKRS